MSGKVIDEDLALLLSFLRKSKRITLEEIYDHFRDLNEEGYDFKHYFKDGTINAKNGYACRGLRSDIIEVCIGCNILVPNSSLPYTHLNVNIDKINKWLKRAGYD